jgi:hypothetical protein
MLTHVTETSSSRKAAEDRESDNVDEVKLFPFFKENAEGPTTGGFSPRLAAALVTPTTCPSVVASSDDNDDE